jgi:hypothetical protein
MRLFSFTCLRLRFGLLAVVGLVMAPPTLGQSSQNDTTVRGYVVDTKTKDPLPGARVEFRSQTGADTIRVQTNEMGHYTTSIPTGSYEVVARFAGYHGTRIRSFQARGSLQIVTPTLFASFTGAVQHDDSTRPQPPRQQERASE